MAAPAAVPLEQKHCLDASVESASLKLLIPNQLPLVSSTQGLWREERQLDPAASNGATALLLSRHWVLPENGFVLTTRVDGNGTLVSGGFVNVSRGWACAPCRALRGQPCGVGGGLQRPLASGHMRCLHLPAAAAPAWQDRFLGWECAEEEGVITFYTDTTDLDATGAPIRTRQLCLRGALRGAELSYNYTLACEGGGSAGGAVLQLGSCVVRAG